MDKYLSKIKINRGCWEWTGSINNKGYGEVSINRKKQRAHRVIYELLVGKIPDGLEIDHLCRNRNCVNPKHLEPVTRLENIRRALPFKKKITHCKNGHKFTKENTKIRIYKNKWRYRVCIKCKNETQLRYSHKTGHYKVSS